MTVETLRDRGTLWAPFVNHSQCYRTISYESHFEVSAPCVEQILHALPMNNASSTSLRTLRYVFLLAATFVTLKPSGFKSRHPK